MKGQAERATAPLSIQSHKGRSVVCKPTRRQKIRMIDVRDELSLAVPGLGRIGIK